MQLLSARLAHTEKPVSSIKKVPQKIKLRYPVLKVHLNKQRQLFQNPILFSFRTVL